MALQLDHLIVPSHDRRAAARLLAQLLGVPWAEQGRAGPFSPVYVNEALTLDFDEYAAGTPLPSLHYCFHVDDARFDAILARLRAAGIAYRSTPHGPDDGLVSPAFGGRLVYWSQPDGHAWEILTRSYARREAAAIRGGGAG